MWHVDFIEDRFACGTCGKNLLRPIFLVPEDLGCSKCPLCKGKGVPATS